jgi:hypothetical protein
MKTNFKKDNPNISNSDVLSKEKIESEDLTQEEFEEYIAKSGAKGSFMVYRSEKKDDELGLDEI